MKTLTTLLAILLVVSVAFNIYQSRELDNKKVDYEELQRIGNQAAEDCKHYNQMVEAANQQISSLEDQLEQLTAENERLKKVGH